MITKLIFQFIRRVFSRFFARPQLATRPVRFMQLEDRRVFNASVAATGIDLSGAETLTIKNGGNVDFGSGAVQAVSLELSAGTWTSVDAGVDPSKYTIAGNTLTMDATLLQDGGPLLNGSNILEIRGSDAASDHLILNLDQLDFIPTGGISFVGGEGAGDNDSLVITGYTISDPDANSQTADVTVNHTGTETGSVVLSGIGTVAFDEIEPLTLSGTAADLVINLPNAADANVVLSDDGVNASVSRIDGSSFELTDFANPTNSLTINDGGNVKTISIQGLDPNFSADLTLNDDAGLNNTVNFETNNTDLGDGNLLVSADTIHINRAILTKGGSVTFNADTLVDSDANGDITTSAAADSGIASGFIDINVSGAGTVDLNGDLITEGADHSAGNGSSGGAVTIDTANGTIAVALIRTDGGDDTSNGFTGGNAGSIGITSGGAQSTTLRASIFAVEGTGNTDGVGGNVLFASDAILNANIAVNAGNGNVTFTGAVDADAAANNRTLAVNSTGATLFSTAVGAAQALGSLTTNAGGTVSLQNVTTSGIQSYGENATLNGTYATTNAAFSVGGTTTLAGNTTVSTGNADVTFSNTMNGTTSGNQNLTITAGTGSVAFNGAVGGTTRLGVIDINSANNVTAVAITAAALNQDAGSGTTTLNGAVNTNTAAGVTLTGTNLAVNQAITTTANGIVTLNHTGTTNIAAAGDINADGAVSITANGGITTAGDITTSNDTITLNASNAGANLTITGGTMTSNGALISLLAGNNISLGGSVNSGAGNVLVQTPNGSITDGNGAATNISGTNATLTATTGSVGATSADVFKGVFDPVEVALTGNLTANAGGAVAVGGTIAGTQTITAQTAYFEATDLNVSGSAFNVKNLAIVLSGTLTIADGGLTVAPPILGDAPGDLRIEAANVEAVTANNPVIIGTAGKRFERVQYEVATANDEIVDVYSNQLDVNTNTSIQLRVFGNTQFTDLDCDLTSLNTNNRTAIIDAQAAAITQGNATGAVVGTTTNDKILSQSLLLLGSGPFTLNHQNNDVTTIAGSVANSVSYRDANGLVVGTISSLFPVAATVGLQTTANNGNITLNVDAGDLTINNVVTAHGSGNVTLSAAGNVAIGALVSSTSGNIAVTADSDASTAGAITDTLAGETANLSTTGTATLSAATGIGSADDIDTTIGSLVATNTTSGNINIQESNGLTIAGTGVRTLAGNGNISIDVDAGNLIVDPAAQTTSSAPAVAGANQIQVNSTVGMVVGQTIVISDADSNQETFTITAIAGNLVTLSANLATNMATNADVVTGGVLAHGSGNILLNTDAGSATLNAPVRSTTGNITVSADAVNQNSSISTGGAGAISVTADTTAITMADRTVSSATNGIITYTALTNVALSQLSNTSDINVTATNGAISDNTALELSNLVTPAGRATLTAATGIGSAGGVADIDTTIGSLVATNTTSGNINIQETNGLTITGSGVQTQNGNGNISIDVDAGNLIVDPAAQTTSSAPAVAGANQIQVNSTVGMAVGQTIVISDADSNQETFTITAIAGNLVTLSANLATNMATNADVVTGGVLAHGSGNILLNTDAGSATLNAPVRSTTGNITVSADAVNQNSSISTGGAGAISVTADTTAITMADRTVSSATNGIITYTALTNVALSQLSNTSDINVTATNGAISDNTALELSNLVTPAGRATLTAATGIGSAGGVADIDTTIGSLVATNTTSGNINIQETNGLTITGSGVQTQNGNGNISIDVDAGNLIVDPAAQTTSSAPAVAGANQIQVNSTVGMAVGQTIVISDADSNQETFTITAIAGNLVTLSANLATNMATNADVVTGGVLAHGSGNILLNTDAGSATLNAPVRSTTGNITVSADAVNQNSSISTGGAGAISVTADTTAITMADRTVSSATNGIITYTALTNVALSQLSNTSDINVTATNGAISDNTALELSNLVTPAGRATLTAATGIGSAGGVADIDTTIGSLVATNTTSGNINIQETNGLTITGSGVQTQNGNGNISIDVDAGNLIVDPAAQTTSSAPAVAGANQIQVNSTVGMAVGQTIVISDADSNQETFTITAIAGNLVTLSANLATNMATNADVVTGGVLAHGSGNILLNTDAGSATLNAPVRSTTGNITVSADAVNQNSSISTGGAGAISVTADTTAITMADRTVSSATNGIITYTALTNVALSQLSNTSDINVTATNGAISDNTALELSNLVTPAGRATLTAATGIGSAGGVADIDTTIGSLVATNTTSGNINIQETNGLTITGSGVQTQNGNGNISIDVDAGNLIVDPAAQTTSSAPAVAGANQIQVNSTVGMAVGQTIVISDADSNQETFTITAIAGNLVTLSANLATNMATNADVVTGGVLAHGSGNILLNTDAGSATLNAPVRSTTGNITVSADAVNQNSSISTGGGAHDSLAAIAAQNATTITLQNSLGFEPGQQVRIGNAIDSDVLTIVSMAGNTLTLSGGLSNLNAQGTEVTVVSELSVIQVTADNGAIVMKTNASTTSKGSISYTTTSATSGDITLEKLSTSGKLIQISAARDVVIGNASSGTLEATTGTTTGVETITITAGRNIRISSGSSISTDGDPTPGQSESSSNDHLTLLAKGEDATNALGTVTFDGVVTIRTDGGVATTFERRPDPNGGADPRAFFNYPANPIAAVVTTNSSNTYTATFDIVIRTPGEENLRLDIDWRDINADGGSVRVESITVQPGMQSVSHEYSFNDLNAFIQSGQNSFLVDFSVSHHNSIQVLGDTIEQGAFSTAVGVGAVTGLAFNSGLLSSTDNSSTGTEGPITGATVVNRTAAVLLDLTLSNTDFYFEGGTVRVTIPTLALAPLPRPEPPQPPTYAPQVAPTIVAPTISALTVSQPESVFVEVVATPSVDIYQLRFAGSTEPIKKFENIPDGANLLHPELLRQWILDNKLNEGSTLELWQITTKEDAEGNKITVERPLLQFDNDPVNSRPFPANESALPEVIPELKLVPMDPNEATGEQAPTDGSSTTAPDSNPTSQIDQDQTPAIPAEGQLTPNRSPVEVSETPALADPQNSLEPEQQIVASSLMLGMMVSQAIRKGDGKSHRRVSSRLSSLVSKSLKNNSDSK
ncbi:MAG: hypothetical protein U0996_22830 [Planctomycetaceae bacterium]